MLVRGLVLIAVAMSLAFAGPIDDAKLSYQKTDYKAVLNILLPLGTKDATAWNLIGKAYFMTTDYKKAAEAFEKSVALAPNNSEYAHWLGRAFGRQAETSNPLAAPGKAIKARQQFERAVVLDSANKEALNDLFDYYLNAPGFLGGGTQKAEELVRQIARLDEAEGFYARAQIADKRKDFSTAEQQLRRAYELAPKQVGRVLDLAKYLAKLGRVKESDQVFEQAVKLAPSSPNVIYTRAEMLVQQKRNLTEAKTLLEKYLNSQLTPDDPPREKAVELLKQARGV
jgi:cytochrome c-type biogenesis protein CcmH/NrfG